MFDKFTRVTELNLRKMLQCNECRRETIHVLEARCNGAWEYYHPMGNVHGATNYSLFRCGACDEIAFEKEAWDSETTDRNEHGEEVTLYTYEQFPPPSSADFSFDTMYVPHRLTTLIDEMMYALAGGMLNLSTIGLRLVVEYIVNDKEGGRSNLVKKIDVFCAKNGIDDEQKALLHIIRVKGNASAHKGMAMTKTEMVAGMSIVGLLLERLYNGPGRHKDAMGKAKKAFKAAEDNDDEEDQDERLALAYAHKPAPKTEKPE